MIRRKIIGFTPTVNPQEKVDLQLLGNFQRKLNRVANEDVIYPLTAPGIPSLPSNSNFLHELQHGEDFLLATEDKPKKWEYDAVSEHAAALACLENLVCDALYSTRATMSVEISATNRKTERLLPGQTLVQILAYGPSPHKIMLIGKMPNHEDMAMEAVLTFKVLDTIREAFGKAGFLDWDQVYATNLIKFCHPENKSTLKANWIKDGLFLLWQEIKIVQPKYIVCMGTEPSKALLGAQATVSDMAGRVETLKYNVAFNKNEEPHGERQALVVTIPSPRVIFKDPSMLRQLETEVQRFVSLYHNGVAKAEVVEHTEVNDFNNLLQMLEQIERETTDGVIAVDAEWHGEHPANAGSYLRTIQLAWAEGKAIGIKLHQAGGAINPEFGGNLQHKWGVSEDVLELLNTFFKGGKLTYEGEEPFAITFRPKRIVGHFFNADLEWLVAYGFDIADQFTCPLHDLHLTEELKSRRPNVYQHYASLGIGDVIPAWVRTKFEGGADTGLMVHALEETANFKLENLAMRYTSAPRYDVELQKWKVQFCKSLGITSKDLDGYGECPDEVLLSYGIYDADVTYRLFRIFDQKLDCDFDGNSCREAFWEAQIATPAVLEIHRTGLTIDKDRVDLLTKHFMDARDGLEHQIQTQVRWPDFNIRSTLHVRELLFGTELNGKINKKTGANVQQRPDTALSLNLQPLMDTSKPPKLWRDIVKRKQQSKHTPCTNKQNLALMAQEADTEAANLLYLMRDYRFLDQVLKTVLRPPTRDEASTDINFDSEGHYVYDQGLASMCCDDGKVRTHIYQTKETGRWSSARPNLQNISKQRDPDYERLLGDRYKHKLRSVLKASPGHVLIEADYVGAELFGMAVMSGDPTMIEHATRNQLSEDHPDYYDIHSNVAVRAFKLTCPPTKTGLESIGKKHIRIVAKSVIFGIAYGRGANAIAVAAREQKIEITKEEAQAVIDAIFQMYPLLRPFFAECQQRAAGVFKEAPGKRVLANCFGRYRRFPDSSHDPALEAEFGRQAMNFPIQSMIASAVSRACGYLIDYKKRTLKKHGVDLYKIVLQIHDAILFEVPFAYVSHFCDYVLPKYMREKVPIIPTDLEGNVCTDKQYLLGMEAEVMTHWGEVISDEYAQMHGLPTGHGGKPGCIVTFSKKSKK